LEHYFSGLSDTTKKRFSPHGSDNHNISQFYKDLSNCGYIAQVVDDPNIIAYAILKRNYLWHDADRLRSYGLDLDSETDCTYAPSVADEWQRKGLGKLMLQFILTDLQASKTKRIILWGGVQGNNLPALRFYEKNGFQKLEQFEYLGANFDMKLEISHVINR
jgi:GNAT superfamily N-acetyltransferase